MRLPNPESATMKILPLLLVTLAMVSVPTLPSISRNTSYWSGPQTATSTAYSNGTLQVLWGDTYLPARINQGNGNETITVTGPIAPHPTLPGFYTYTYPSTTGELEAQWTTGNDYYFVDVYFYQGYSPYNKTTIFPSENTFAALYIYFRGQLTINGLTSQVQGLAALVAAAPGYFSFNGTARANTVILYPRTYHGNEYIFRWSQASQIINGIAQPGSQSITQTVKLS